jgi:glycosyl transferase family 25
MIQMPALPIIVINLDRDEDRFAFMRRQIVERFGLPITRHRGTEGWALTGEDLIYRKTGRRAALSNAEVGCLLSHIKVWQRIADSAEPCALVMEDDVHCADSFGDVVRAVKMDANDLGLQRLETMQARVTVSRRPKEAGLKHQLQQLHTNHAGAAAYVMTKAAARVALSFIQDFGHPPDTELFDPQRGSVRGLRIEQWVPAPCIQDMILVKAGHAAVGFTSHLEPDRLDYRNGKLSRRPSVVAQVKQVLRPLYTSLFSLALAPSGRQRVEVPFG